MKVDALIMDPKDNVVTCVRDVKSRGSGTLPQQK